MCELVYVGGQQLFWVVNAAHVTYVIYQEAEKAQDLMKNDVVLH